MITESLMVCRRTVRVAHSQLRVRRCDGGVLAMERRNWGTRRDVAHFDANEVLDVVDLVRGALDDEHLLCRVGICIGGIA